MPDNNIIAHCQQNQHVQLSLYTNLFTLKNQLRFLEKKVLAKALEKNLSKLIFKLAKLQDVDKNLLF